MSCLKIIYDYFEMFISELSEYFDTEIHHLTKYNDKYMHDEETSMELKSLDKIYIQNDEDQIFGFEIV